MAAYCHPAYLTYIQITLCKMPGWLKHKLESKLLEEISQPQILLEEIHKIAGRNITTS